MTRLHLENLQRRNARAVRFAQWVLKRSSLLVVTAAATEKTRHLLNRERLAMLQDGAVVINIARGSLIDLDALTREVKSGRLRCALDVTDPGGAAACQSSAANPTRRNRDAAYRRRRPAYSRRDGRRSHG